MPTGVRQQPRSKVPLFLLMVILTLVLLWFALTRSYAQLEELTYVEATTRATLHDETQHHLNLMATEAYVDSVERIKDFQHGEANRQLPGETAIQIDLQEVVQAADQSLVPDAAAYARPWQMWWHLLSDVPAPNAP